ncbi:MAG: hypothetical protein BGO43_02845 [Gammaproteobacteria bacterium 39-13]|nr:MAG: hypothetical protein BGO43_02845 [Gammaproteobacteria bacterium 39-13]
MFKEDSSNIRAESIFVTLSNNKWSCDSKFSSFPKIKQDIAMMTSRSCNIATISHKISFFQ